jgi:hypothetical protein
MQDNFSSAIVKIWQNFVQRVQGIRFSKSPSPDARALRRLSRRITRLAQKTKTQINTVDRRVKDLDTEKLAWMQDKFDASAYRKSLEANVYGHVLQRVQTVLWAVTLLGGAAIYTGLEIRLGNQLETEVDAAVEKTIAKELDQRIADVLRDLEEGRRDNLLSLLQQAAVADEGGSFARARIEQYKQDEEYLKLLQDFISIPKIPEEQEIAVRYLQTNQDADLQTVLIEAFRNRNTDPEIRAQMFQALLKYPKDTKLRALEVIRQEATTESSLWQDAIETLATERINSPIAGDIMRIALQDDEPDMSRWAATFFILNPKQWKASDANIAIKADLLTGAVVQTLVEANKADAEKEQSADTPVVLSRAQQKQVIDTLTNLSDQTNNSSDLTQNQVWQTQFEAIRRSLALTLLHAGSPNLFEEVSNNNGYYAYEVWLDEVLPWFDNFKLDQDKELRAAATEEEQHSNQYQLLMQLGNSYWDTATQKYQIFEADQLEPKSIDRLKQGDVSLFLRLMASTYYSSADLWRTQVLPLFPDAVKPNQTVFAAPSTGTNEEQDALWNWVQAQSDQLVWNDQSKKYELQPAPTAAGGGR